MIKQSKHNWAMWRTFVAAGATVAIAAPQVAHAAISEQEEIRAGQQVAQQAEKEFGRRLPDSDPRARRVRLIGQQFARLSTRRNIPYSFSVLQNDKVLNAFAAPGGPVFVTTKLLETTSNDAELAYVLGHETGHIERRHVVKQAEKQQKLGIYSAIAGAIFGRTGQAVGGLYGGLKSLKYSRKDESDADAVGVRWMAKLGYDPRAAVTMLGKLGSGGSPDFLSDHPDPKARQSSVNKLIQTENLLNVATQNGGPRLWRSGVNNVNDYDNGYTNNGNNSYPDDNGYNSGNQNTSYYPPTNDNGYDNGYTNANGEIDLGAPIRLRASGESNIIIAPVAGLARWAGATVSNSGTTTTLRRAGRTVVLRRNSRIMELNGESYNMSVAATLYNGTLYAPLGTIARALGATATLENDIVRLSLPGRTSGYVRVP